MVRRYIVLSIHAVAAVALWRWPPSRAAFGTCLIHAGYDLLETLPDAEMSDDFAGRLEAEMMAAYAECNGKAGPL